MKKLPLLSTLFLFYLASITGCESRKNVHSETQPHSQNVRKTNGSTETVINTSSIPIRRTWQVEQSTMRRSEFRTILSALLREATFKIEVRPNGDQLLTVIITSLSNVKLEDDAAASLAQLGFRAGRRNSSTETRYAKLIKAGSAPRLLKKLKTIYEKTALQIATLQEDLDQASRPGLRAHPELPQQWAMGQLRYSGHPLDLAMPITPNGAHYFVEIILSEDRPELNLKAGDRALSRGGRCYLGPKNNLRVQEGRIAPLSIPKGIRGLEIRSNGTLISRIKGGQEKIVGQLTLVKHLQVRGDGRVFTATQPNHAQPLRLKHQNVPAVLIGHLEYPAKPSESISKNLQSELRLFNILKGIREALTAPQPTGPNDPSKKDGATPPPERQRQIVLAADIPSSVAHLTALGAVVKTALGRTTFSFQENPTSQAQFIAALSKALRGLAKRMSICQQNYSNADRTRDNQKTLKPYRRKIVTIGKEAEILIEEDNSAFRKVKKPEDPDAGPDGFVVYPNVDRRVEAAEFRRVSQEYALLRSVLERVEPDVIFPNPPTLQGGESSK